MNNMIYLNETEFENVRRVIVNDEVYYVGNDVAKVLGYKNARKAVRNLVDSEDKRRDIRVFDTLGRDNYPVIINESGFYSLIFGSKKPKAKRFQHWITHEVLPLYFRYGYYYVGMEQKIESERVKKLFTLAFETLSLLRR